MALRDGLVGYWKCDDEYGVTDLVGTANGSVSGATSGLTGQIGDAYSLDGVNDVINFGDNYDFGTGDFSISLWFKTSSTGFDYFATKGTGANSGAAPGWGVAQTNGALYGFITDSGGRQILSTVGSGLNDGAWHHAVWVFDRDANCTIYIDGSAQTPESISGTSGTLNNAENFRWGILSSASSYGEFEIDEVGLWDRVITSDEVTSLYNSGTGQTYPFNTTLWNGLRAYYPLDDYAGVKDLVNQNATLTNSGATASTTGKIGTTYDFDGTNDYMSVSSPSWISDTEGSVSMWINLDVVTAEQVFTAIKAGSTTYRFQVNVVAGKLNYGYSTAGGTFTTIIASDNVVITANTWHHVVLTVENGVGTKFYVDGSSIAITASTGSTSDAYWWGDNANFDTFKLMERFTGEVGDGQIDEVAVYNRPLTSAEVTELYNSGSGLGHPFTSIGQQLVSHWSLDGSTTLLDEQNLYDGTNVGSTFDSAGKLNATRTMVTNDQIEFGDVFDFGSSDFSIAAWINTNNLPGTHETIVGKYWGTAAERSWWFYVDSGGSIVGVTSSNGTTTSIHTSTDTITTNTWYHVVWTKSGTTSTLYINGTADSGGTGTVDSSCYNNVNETCIGGIKKSDATRASNWDGEIDEVSIWYRVLSSTEVTNLYNSGSGLQYPFATATETDISVTTDTLVITEYSVTLGATLDINVGAPGGGVVALNLTEQSATVGLSVDISAGFDALTITENALTVGLDLEVTAGTDTLSITENTTGVGLALDISAGFDTLSITENSVTIGGSLDISVGFDALAITENSVTVGQGLDISIGYDALAITEQAATVGQGLDISVGYDALIITELGQTVNVGIILESINYTVYINQNEAVTGYITQTKDVDKYI